MKIFFIVVTCFLVFAVVQSCRYRNPYGLTFVFGKKGSGKTLWMVKQMIRYHNRGWHVYTDMSDCNLPYARIINPEHLATFRPEPHSLICLDEAGITYDNRKFKSLPDGVRDFYKYVRKMKCRVILNSQSYDIDKKIRDTVDDMYLMQGIGGWCGLIRPIKRSVTLTEPTSEAESRICDKLSFGSIFSWRFSYFPRWFKYFDTAAMPSREEIPYECHDRFPESKNVGRVAQTIRDVWRVARTKLSRGRRHHP